jgi:hypothetical protein
MSLFGRLGNVFEYIATKFDDDPFANTFIRCNSCGSWENAMFGNSCCSVCGADFDGTEDTQRGIRPPGWTEDDD